MATAYREERQRGPVGVLFKWLFIGFNILMPVWLISGCMRLANLEAPSVEYKIGYAIGGFIGGTALIFIWMMGTIILGILVYLTRGQSVMVEDRGTRSREGGSWFGGGETPEPIDADDVIARYQAKRETETRVAATAQALSARARPQTPATAGFGKRR